MFRLEIFQPIHTLSLDPNNCLLTETSFFCWFQKVSHPLTTKKRIMLGCFSRCKLTIEWPCCTCYCTVSYCLIVTTLYGILLRNHFVSQNKIFRCTYFFMQFRIKFLLFNDFPCKSDMQGNKNACTIWLIWNAWCLIVNQIECRVICIDNLKRICNYWCFSSILYS